MIKKSPNNQLHQTPPDVKKHINLIGGLLDKWQDITPLAQNEWICWIESAKKPETRERRLKIMGENLLTGKRRPCCWAGCPHRSKK